MHLVPRELKDRQKAQWASIIFAGKQFDVTLSLFPHCTPCSSLCPSALPKEVDKVAHRAALRDFTPSVPCLRAIAFPLSSADWGTRKGKEQGAVDLNESPLWLTVPFFFYHIYLILKTH